ncbi:MAG: phosphoglycerate dehydrogenase [Deltaproteobacteria bacterium]|nr:phosphoglycerate dehydrogenase [Deltaproteobacteria bacterium]
MGEPIVLVTEPLEPSSLDYLRAHARLLACEPAEVAGQIGRADGLVVRTYTRVDAALLDRAERLKVVGRAGVALDNIDLSACRARGVEVVHTPEANTLAVVDYSLRMIIEMNRRFWPFEAALPAADFHAVRQQTYGRFLADCCLGIIGCGRIGSRLGRAAAGLGMRVVYNDIREIAGLDFAAEPVSKARLYAESDIVSLHVPLTEATHKLVDASSLELFKPGAQLVNAARGACVDAAALAAALRSGRIGAAVIDCHDPEPPGPDYPLLGLERVILTPHIAARVPKAVQNMSDVVFDVIAVLEGRKPRYPAPPA